MKIVFLVREGDGREWLEEFIKEKLKRGKSSEAMASNLRSFTSGIDIRHLVNYNIPKTFAIW